MKLELQTLHAEFNSFKQLIMSKLDDMSSEQSSIGDKKMRKSTSKKDLRPVGKTVSEINRFRSVAFVNNGSEVEEDIETDESSDSDDEISMNRDSDHQPHKTIVFSTSMTRDIDQVEFNKCFVKGHARFQKFHGGRARHMKEYVQTHMREEKPDTVIIHAGGNDLRTMRNNPTPPMQVANEIIDIGLACKKNGASRVIISGVITRKPKFLQDRCRDVNEVLASLCEISKFTYIDNKDITLDYLLKDGVHLNDEGSVLLAQNYLNCLNKL